MSVQSAPSTSHRTQANDLRSFYDFVGEKLRISEPPLRPEDVWEEWQLSHTGDAEDLEADYLAIRASIDAMNAGEPAKTLEQFEREFRERHGLPRS